MNTIKLASLLLLTLFSINSYSIEKKTIIHLSTLPVTEGLGIYSSVIAIQDGNSVSKAAGITNISILALNAGLGSFIAFGKPANYTTFSKVHHIIGFTAIGASLWLTISSATDNALPKHLKFTSGGYTAMTTVPLFIFNF